MDNKLVCFEAIRKRKGGGTLVAIHEDFLPKLVGEYCEDSELIVIKISTIEKCIGIISGYGPQENWDEDKRLPFFIALETEIEKAELAGRSVIIGMDSNSKMGPKYTSGDPHVMSPNGALLAGIIERHNLILGNGSTKCTGIITKDGPIKAELRKYWVSMRLKKEKSKN